ncbi:MAG: nucleotidyl transferase AbiEii/AbiGii toxin family protein [bacterium]|nr:nucleotidyl transferase AbiEii/AbiGii toxin family protein [bacterium]
MQNKIYWEILNKSQKEVLPKLFFLRGLGAYLAGGTALALQIGHRTSIDFDFYTPRHFKSGALGKLIKKNSPDCKIKILRDTDDTFEAVLNSRVRLSLFYYYYKLLKKLTDFEKTAIISLEDIAAMKLIAISQRGKRRDFVDFYYLLKILDLRLIMEATEKKYPDFDIYNGLRGLLYFKDADDDLEISRIKIYDKKLSWKRVKGEIEKKVKEFNKKEFAPLIKGG